MKKEYMLSIEELKLKFPLYSIQKIDGKEYMVSGYEKPMASNCMASFPRIVFTEIHPTIHD